MCIRDNNYMLQLLNLSKVILLFSFCSVININCKSKNGKTNTPLTIENIAGVYTITDAKIKTGDTEKDVYNSFNDCQKNNTYGFNKDMVCLLYTSPSPRDRTRSRMPSSA